MKGLLLAWQLARKDLRLFWADRRGALLCFAVPVLLAALFGTVFHRDGEGTPRLAVLLVVEDDHPATQRIADKLQANSQLDVERVTRAEAQEKLRCAGGGVAIVLPRNFGAALSRAQSTLEILHHPASQMEAGWAEGVLTEVILRVAAEDWLVSLPVTFGGSRAKLERPFAVEHVALAGPGGVSANSYSHSFCGMTLQYLLFWGMDSGLLLLRERRQGIWRRVLTAPIHLSTIITGKALATSLVALAQVVVVFTVGATVFGVRLTGSLAGFIVLTLAAALLSAATGLLVAALGGSETRSRSVAVLAILTFSMLGGLWLPSFLLPGWVQRLALALPTTWAARGFAGVTWQGMGWSDAALCATIVSTFSAAFFVVALLLFRRAEARPGG